MLQVYSPLVAVSFVGVPRDCFDVSACQLLPVLRLDSTNHRLGRKIYHPGKMNEKFKACSKLVFFRINLNIYILVFDLDNLIPFK